MAAAMVTLVSCGNSGDTAGGNPSTPQTTSPTAGPVGSPMITPSPTPATPRPPSPIRPSTPTAQPIAKDGQNYKACADGNCEVLVRKAASFTLSGERVKVTVADGTVKVTTKNGYISISGGGLGTWNNANGPLHTVSLKSAEGSTAIIRLTTH